MKTSDFLGLFFFACHTLILDAHEKKKKGGELNQMHKMPNSF